ncbi:hypothetical protein GVN21_04145 [Caulobacter sp. SLTY]|uniref:hypothetical protein n=1 Tax=Caulobacter sp. SLTY TaxID=2683262 RepID=UPI001412569F|nr:hypothetical protein [Caulobacter sp. SLTY]NBB14550.1 hypothetical protein [Caulobacter sp. SLTY]
MTIPLWLIVSFGIAVLVNGFAVWKGGPPERLTGIFLFVSAQITFLVADRRWMDVQFAVMCIDILAFGLFVALALFADRWWTLWTAGLQGLGVVIHLAFWAQQKVISLVYATALNLIGYAIFLTLVIGTIAHIRRKAERQRGAS